MKKKVKLEARVEEVEKQLSLILKVLHSHQQFLEKAIEKSPKTPTIIV